jgi:hypothetical protein
MSMRASASVAPRGNPHEYAREERKRCETIFADTRTGKEGSMNDENTTHNMGRRCLLRIAEHGGWCVREEDHDDECAGYPSRQATQANTFGPEQAGNRRWG